MSDCTGKFFLLNNNLLPQAEFDAIYNPPAHYIYEVFRVDGGIPVFIEDHLDRLWHTAELAVADFGIDRVQMLHRILKVIDHNPKGEGNIKIVFYLTSGSDSQLFIYFTPHQYPTIEQYAKGVKVNLFFAERTTPNAKIMDTRMRKATDEIKSSESLYEVLLVDQNGFITEGSRSNVFFIKDREVITPPPGMVLPGVTRKQIIRLCKESGIKITERPVHSSTLGEADALFISGTSRRVLPVNRVGEMSFNVDNQLMRRIAELLDQHVKEYIVQHKN